MTKDPTEPSCHLFGPLPSGWWYKTVQAHTNKLRNETVSPPELLILSLPGTHTSHTAHYKHYNIEAYV